MQGVPQETIDRYSVYSVETAEAMAVACAHAFGTDIGIGVTGTMGNVDPANSRASVPGRVFFSVSAFGKLCSRVFEIETQPSRFAYKMAVAKEVCDVLVEII